MRVIDVNYADYFKTTQNGQEMEKILKSLESGK